LSTLTSFLPPPKVLNDVPFAHFLPELLNIAPDLRVAHTLREPFLWLERRVNQHGGDDLLCLPHSAAPNATGDFYLAECFEGTGNIGARLRSGLDVMSGLYNATVLEPGVLRKKFTRPIYRALARAFTAHREFAYTAFHAHNQRVTSHVPSERYYQFCFWDSDNASTVFAPILEGLAGPDRKLE
jgi:hypothetical protein